MKITGSLKDKNKDNIPVFHVYFEDGMTIDLSKIKESWKCTGMLSTGLNSYYLKTGKWPSGSNLNKRVELGVAFIEKNIKNNRYKK